MRSQGILWVTVYLHRTMYKTIHSDQINDFQVHLFSARQTAISLWSTLANFQSSLSNCKRSNTHLISNSWTLLKNLTGAYKASFFLLWKINSSIHILVACYVKLTSFRNFPVSWKLYNFLTLWWQLYIGIKFLSAYLIHINIKFWNTSLK